MHGHRHRHQRSLQENNARPHVIVLLSHSYIGTVSMSCQGQLFHRIYRRSNWNAMELGENMERHSPIRHFTGVHDA